MKLSFSTLGCPNWSWREVLSSAADMGYDGIEIRGLGDDLYAPSIPVFSPARIDTTKAQLKEYGVYISCFATECRLFDIKEDVVANVSQYLNLASYLGCKYLRLLADGAPGPGAPINESLVLDRMQRLAPMAAAHGVTLLVETNGVYADTKKLHALLDQVDSAYIGALWDINHPVRFFGETVEQTYENIGPYLKYVHLKDSVALPDGSVQYRMLTKGDLPVREMIGLLKNAGYAGYLSLEWVKRWNPDLEDAGIVFAHYINKMKTLLHE